MKSIRILVGLAFFSLMFASCNKDDDNNSSGSANEITIGDLTLSINSSFRKGGNLISEGVYEHEIYLLGEGLSYDADGNISGQGSMVYANVYTDSQAGLSNGTYEYPPFGEDPGTFAIRFVTAGVDLDFDDPNGTNPDDISNGSSGTITISGSGSNKQISIDVTATNANKIEAQFMGDLEKID